MGFLKNMLFNFENSIPGNRKRMFNKINSFLTAVKLSIPNNYYYHNIYYKIHNEKSPFKSKELYVLKDYKTDNGDYKIQIEFVYFVGGIKIRMKDNKHKDSLGDKKKGTYLEVEIDATNPQVILNDEFKFLMKKYFNITIYTKEDFNENDKYFCYNEVVRGSRRRITNAFIKLNIACEKMGTRK